MRLLAKTSNVVALLSFAVLGMSGWANAEPASPPVEKDWTVMVYLNGDNDLDPFGTKDMEEMERVGSSDRVNIVVLRDTSDQSVSTKIYSMKKGSASMSHDFGANIDMGDWRTLVGFFEYVQTNFPARHYLVDVWNHGAGWSRKRPPLTRGISYDDGSGNHITTPQLGQALAAIRNLNGGRKLDVFGMDACLMQMSEVLYEIGDSADIVVASEETVPADGWPYDAFLADLTRYPEMTSAALATRIVETFRDAYTGVYGLAVNASAVDTAAFFNAQGSWNAFVREALPWLALYHSELIEGFSTTQSYADDTYVDQIALLNTFKNTINSPALAARADAAIRDLGAAVLMNIYVDERMAQSHGISIWAPTPETYRVARDAYAELRWARDGDWKTFLEALAYPKTPIVHLEKVVARGLTPGDFVNAGADVALSLHFENDSGIPGTGIGLTLEPPAGFTAKDTTAQIDLTPATGMKANARFVVHPDSSVAPGDYSFGLRVNLPGQGEFTTFFPLRVERAYQVGKRNVSTPHPYNKSTTKDWTIIQAGANAIRIHFSRFATEGGADFVYLYDRRGEVVKVYSGNLGSFWSEEVPGDTVRIRFISDDRDQLYGFNIDRIAY